MSNVDLFKAAQDVSKKGFLEFKKGDILLRLDKDTSLARNLRTGQEGLFEYKRVDCHEDLDLGARFEVEMTERKKEKEDRAEAAKKSKAKGPKAASIVKTHVEESPPKDAEEEERQKKARDDEKWEHEKSVREEAEVKNGYVRGYIQSIDFIGGEIELSEDAGMFSLSLVFAEVLMNVKQAIPGVCDVLHWFPKFMGKINDTVEARRSRALETACFEKLYLTGGRWKRDEFWHVRRLLCFDIDFRENSKTIPFIETTKEQNDAEFDLMATLPGSGSCSGYIDSFNPVDGYIRLSGDECKLANDPLYVFHNKPNDPDLSLVFNVATKGLFVTCEWTRQTIVKMRFIGSFKVDMAKPTRGTGRK